MPAPVIIVLAGVAAAALVGRPLTRWVNTIRRPGTRVAAALLLVSPTLAIVFVVGCFVGSLPMESGGWRCLVCNKGVRETQYFGIPVSSSVANVSAYYKDADREFERWYWKNIGKDHGHDWIPIGCHFSSWRVACSFDRGRLYYHALPRLPDPALAVAMARKVVAAPPERRREMIRSFEWFQTGHSVAATTDDEVALLAAADRGEPWRTLAEGGSMSQEEFQPLYALWLRAHPEWQ